MIIPFFRPVISSETVKKGIQKFFNSLHSHHTITEIYKKEFIYNRPYTFAKLKEVPMAQSMSDGLLHVSNAEIKTELVEEKEIAYFRRDKIITIQLDVYGKVKEKDEVTYPEERISMEKYYQLKGSGAIEL